MRRAGSGGGMFGPPLAAIARAAGGPDGSAPLRNAALVTQREVKLELSHPGTGNLYTTEFFVTVGRSGGMVLRRGRERPPHRASAPGEPPAPDYGELRASIEVEVMDGVAYVGSGLARARWLEHGFVSAWGTTVEPRPFMRTVMERLPALLRDVLATEYAGLITLTLRESSP